MSKRRGKKGDAWNTQVFTQSIIARSGGPVRRHKSSIRRSSSLASLAAMAQRQGWSIVQQGQWWTLYKDTIEYVQVLGPPPVLGCL